MFIKKSVYLSSMLENIIEREKLAHKPIVMPEHPYVASLKDFGGDELLAGIIDIGATALVAATADPEWRNYVLPFVGPVFEKFVFLGRHAVKAWQIYQTVPTKIKQPFSFYLRQGIKDGTDNLIKDVMFHDPMYIAFMALGLSHFPKVPPFMLSALSYGVAVLAVSGIDVAKEEFNFRRKKKSMRKIGFKAEKFYESRFYIRSDKNPNEVAELLRKEFSLGKGATSVYTDTYFETKLQSFNGKKPKARFRSRKTIDDPNIIADGLNSLQIVYSRARENKTSLDQVRYFVLEKEKIIYPIDREAHCINEINGDLRKFLDHSVAPEPYYSNVCFERTNWAGPELAMYTDKIKHERPFYLIELKVWKDLKLLQKAMRFLMVECPIVSIQTTYGKREIMGE